MRILVCPHDLIIGGSSINAIDLAHKFVERGHSVAIYGVPGPLVEYIRERGLRYIPARRLKYRPAPSRIAQLAGIVARERFDIIHAVEWPACLDAYFGAGLFMRTPILCTIAAMEVSPYVPTSVPLVMGTADLGDQARRGHAGGVWVVEPPIDTERDNPGIDGAEFRRAHGIAADELLVMSVSRLVLDLKIDALVRGIDAVDRLAGRYPVRLLLIGEGHAHSSLMERAQAVNARWGREVVSLPGPQIDPRPAYAAADVVIGMGSSALRALSIGRPVVVQGEQGFSHVFEEDTLEIFLRQGFHGVANNKVGVDVLAAQIERLLADPDLRRHLGRFGRKVVAERFSLDRAAEVQLDIYRQVLQNPPRHSFAEAVRFGWRALKLELDYHDPRQKKDRRRWEKAIHDAVREGSWPPPVYQPH